MNSKYRQHGFTLIEVLVSTAVISIVLIVASGLLILFFQEQRQVRSQLYMQSNARSMMSTITDRVHEGVVDYSYYSSTVTSLSNHTVLPIRNNDGTQTAFRFDSSNNLLLCERKAPPEYCNPTITADWVQMNPDDIHFVVGAFAFYPNSNPYPADSSQTPSTNISQFIYVGMQLETEDNGQQTEYIQTGLTPRYYAR